MIGVSSNKLFQKRFTKIFNFLKTSTSRIFQPIYKKIPSSNTKIFSIFDFISFLSQAGLHIQGVGRGDEGEYSCQVQTFSDFNLLTGHRGIVKSENIFLHLFGPRGPLGTPLSSGQCPSVNLDQLYTVYSSITHQCQPIEPYNF